MESRCDTNGVAINRRQLQSLLASQRALQESVTIIIDILQESSKSIHHQSCPRDVSEDPAREKSLARQSSKNYEDDHLHDIGDTGKVNAEARNDVASQFLGVRIFEVENARARKMYFDKQNLSLDMYNRAGASYLSREYHFQCKHSMSIRSELEIRTDRTDKFYPDDVYEKAASDPAVLGFDPWLWASELPEQFRNDDSSAHGRSEHGKLPYKMVLQRKAELMEALFPLRTSHHIQCMSWPELENSYRHHLKSIVRRVGFAKCDNPIGFVDSDIVSAIIEVGRFFTEIDYSNRPKDFEKRNIPAAVGPFANGQWPDYIRKQYTLNSLHQRCHSKGLLKDWQNNRIRRFMWDAAGAHTALSIPYHEAELVYILEIVLSIKNRESSTEHLLARIGDKDCNKFILDFLDELIPLQFEEGLEQVNGHGFSMEELNFGMLKSLGGLSIIWTDCIDDHLRLSPSSRTLKLFWDISLLDQSLLFWFDARCLKQSSSGATKIPILQELRTIYRVLFHNKDARHFLSKETCAVNASKGSGIMIHDLRVNIYSSRARKILKFLLQSRIPSELERNHPSNKLIQAISRSSKRVWWRIGRVLQLVKGILERKLAPQTLFTFLAAGPPYPLDLCWHLENILLPYPQYFGESDNTRAFSHFPRFEPRLRELKFYMDNQKPRGWYHMWKDNRDRIQHVTFWAVLVFGTISVALALGSLAVSSAQTAAAFEALS